MADELRCGRSRASGKRLAERERVQLLCASRLERKMGKWERVMEIRRALGAEESKKCEDHSGRGNTLSGA